MHFLIENVPQFDNQFQFRLMNNAKESILVSRLFTSKEICHMAISATRRAGVEVDNYPIWDLPGNIRFNLFVARDCLLIGAIRYKTIEERDQAIQTVANGIAQATTRDQTFDLPLAA
ncbi:hypothetical protein [Larkinella rosea]|uniref:DUF1508 domain-containing protein n=1 Tax=Larkinella rosea TaxID=2025312 RepID=A0A3P1BZM7_9BACT|nr:hypothetical protein [Larkinella rosea]RRB06438.1 hypothetical protein EHT25_01130 [Larkinella rosea]